MKYTSNFVAILAALGAPSIIATAVNAQCGGTRNGTCAAGQYCQADVNYNCVPYIKPQQSDASRRCGGCPGNQVCQRVAVAAAASGAMGSAPISRYTCVDKSSSAISMAPMPTPATDSVIVVTEVVVVGATSTPADQCNGQCAAGEKCVQIANDLVCNGVDCPSVPPTTEWACRSDVPPATATTITEPPIEPSPTAQCQQPCASNERCI